LADVPLDQPDDGSTLTCTFDVRQEERSCTS